MDHKLLSESCFNIAREIKCSCNKLSPDERCRAIFNRLYYSLYHKYLSLDASFANSPVKEKHKLIQDELKKSRFSKEVRDAYSRFYELRIWSDYKLDTCPTSYKIDILEKFLYQVGEILKLEKFEIK